MLSFAVDGTVDTIDVDLGDRVEQDQFGIVMLLIWQFNSFRRSLIVVLLCLPLAVAGAAVGLLVSGSWFGFMAILGLLSLGGIIVNYVLAKAAWSGSARHEQLVDQTPPSSQAVKPDRQTATDGNTVRHFVIRPLAATDGLPGSIQGTAECHLFRASP